ncbi:uncharacterized protein L969DRAFT_19906 [Mixia osmundae IAM 14324]|uniref:Uncharacterized protein n=1 Tax=Mixia osmundae (strain CBS 9802 / IAM 14324 / JCM 22182 / KY 12970) TaxID=764103 RepID=G7E2H6_MIXOS|nr:uncharacterized protein L969DRAFT_19906 [Mixia osmundae IAM 14324]KEI36908.1 hypothetical protein L969DRAFT_19906 [Mixia osmundae IAM 14324]GAA97036.1 hypothetical protein E5Q_03711 [Mixia osmundae IAM 14324]
MSARDTVKPDGQATLFADKRGEVSMTPAKSSAKRPAKEPKSGSKKAKTEASTKAETAEDGEQASRTSRADVGEMDEQPAGTIEKGHIYFFYRPKVDDDDPKSLDDVSKFFVVLSPRQANDKDFRYYRSIDVGKKRLPDVDRPGQGALPKEIFWSCVMSAGSDYEALKAGLASSEYDTKTAGHRVQPSCRMAGRGNYSIHYVPSEKSDAPSQQKSYLNYITVVPDQLGEVQKSLGIKQESSILLQVKDPHQSAAGFQGLPEERRAKYPDELQALFKTKNRPANPTALLDYVGAELLLIASADKVEATVGEADAKELSKEADSAHSLGPSDAQRELHLDSKENPAEALEGDWT